MEEMSVRHAMHSHSPGIGREYLIGLVGDTAVEGQIQKSLLRICIGHSHQSGSLTRTGTGVNFHNLTMLQSL